MDLSRRELLKAGTILGAGAVGGTVLAAANSGAGRNRAGEYPWSYNAVDPSAVADRAYRGYWEAGCMFAVFDGVVGLLADLHGEPFSSFPTSMMSYGGGGVAGWGTLCGALNGAGAAVSLFVAGEDRNILNDEIIKWYVDSELPKFVPKIPRNDLEIKTGRAKSPLCHISISNSGYLHTTTQRSERCGRLTADVAMQTAALLNSRLEGGFRAEAGVMAETSECLDCHDGDGSGPRAYTKMNCIDCHPQDDKRAK